MDTEQTLMQGNEPATRETKTMEIATTRAAQEVQASMIIAKRFPRDHNQAYTRIMQACKRKSLAEQAMYVYPRGDTKVMGPSIRLAEAVAQNWGNMDFGIIELAQNQGSSEMMAFAWDLETNTKSKKIFTVKHERHTKRGTFFLDDPRDIYEMVANQGARRMRACILSVIPGDIIEAAETECKKTLTKAAGSEPIGDRIRKMISTFAEMSITAEMISTRIGHKADSIDEAELIQLRQIYQAIKDGMGKREDYFNPKPAEESAKDKGKSKTERIKDKAKADASSD